MTAPRPVPPKIYLPWPQIEPDLTKRAPDWFMVEERRAPLPLVQTKRQKKKNPLTRIAEVLTDMKQLQAICLDQRESGCGENSRGYVAPMPRKTSKRRLDDPHKWALNVSSALKGLPPPTDVLKSVMQRQAAAKKAAKLKRPGVTERFVDEVKALARGFRRG